MLVTKETIVARIPVMGTIWNAGHDRHRRLCWLTTYYILLYTVIAGVGSSGVQDVQAISPLSKSPSDLKVPRSEGTS